MSFKIGEPVVCIKPTGNLVKNEIYTIAMVRLNGECINVIEAQNHLGYDGYHSWRFRKLDYDFVEEVLEMVMDEQLVNLEQF